MIKHVYFFQSRDQILGNINNYNEHLLSIYYVPGTANSTKILAFFCIIYPVPKVLPGLQ